MAFQLEFELNGARLVGHDHYWQVIRDRGVGATFTISDVLGETRGHRDSVGDFMRRLTRAGYLQDAGSRPSHNPHSGLDVEARLFRLTRAPTRTPSLQRNGKESTLGRGHQQIWNILRGPQARSGLTTDEVALLAATDEVSVTALSVKAYVQPLERAGYLIVTRRPGRNGKKAYRLKASLASRPLAPKICRARGLVYDPNTMSMVGSAIAEEVA